MIGIDHDAYIKDWLNMTRLVLVIWALAAAVLLSACGGGGSGGGGSSGGGTALSFNPNPLTANLAAGTSTTLTVRATVNDPSQITGSVYVVVVDSLGVLVPGSVGVTAVSDTVFSATLHTSALLTAGRRQGSLSVQLCKDLACAAQYPGSPSSLPYDFTVTPAPLTATPATSTAATVHRGGSVANAVQISVRGPDGAWTASTSASWLSVLGGSGTGSGNFSVQYLPAALAVGSYSDTVVVRSADGQRVEINFSLQVLPTQFVLTSGVPSFSAVNGATIAPQSVSFELNNKVASPWTASSSAAWMLAGPLMGTTPSVITLQPDPTRGTLSSGAYTSDLVLSSNGVESRTVTTSLALTQATLSAPAMAVTLGGAKGRDFSAQSVPISLNTGNTAWPWALSALPNWLSSNTPTGQVSQSASQIRFAPDISSVTAGSVSTTVHVNAAVNGDNVSLPLTVNLNADQRRLLASQWGVGLASAAAGSVLSRTLHIKDNFGGTLAWTATSDADWLKVTPAGATGSGVGMVLTANPASLPNAVVSYANVTVRTDAAGVEPAVVRVALWKDADGTSTQTQLPLEYTHLVADTIRPYVYANRGGTSIDVYNAHTGQRVSTIAAVGSALGEMTVSPDGSRLYALDTATRTLQLVDLSSGTRIEGWALTYAVGASTSVLALRPNGVEVVLVGDGTAYAAGKSLGRTPIYGTMTASADGLHVYTQDSGFSPATVAAFDVDYSAISGGILMVSERSGASFINGASNGADIAVSGSGAALYVASGAPYKCSSVQPSNLSFIGSLPGGNPYPNNVEVTSDGRAICGISGWYSESDFWVHSSAGALLKGYKVAGYARALLPRQMVVTPDGLVVVALTDDPQIAFVPIGP